jgi:hypothetical protein
MSFPALKDRQSVQLWSQVHFDKKILMSRDAELINGPVSSIFINIAFIKYVFKNSVLSECAYSAKMEMLNIVLKLQIKSSAPVTSV